MTRNNKQIWRIAEWLFKTFEREIDWSVTESWRREWWYDKSAELQKKLASNDFTGDDSHGD